VVKKKRVKKNQISKIKTQKHKSKVKNETNWVTGLIKLAVSLFNVLKGVFVGIKGVLIK
jgi:hypothetical protein